MDGLLSNPSPGTRSSNAVGSHMEEGVRFSLSSTRARCEKRGRRSATSSRSHMHASSPGVGEAYVRRRTNDPSKGKTSMDGERAKPHDIPNYVPRQDTTRHGRARRTLGTCFPLATRGSRSADSHFRRGRRCSSPAFPPSQGPFRPHSFAAHGGAQDLTGTPPLISHFRSLGAQRRRRNVGGRISRVRTCPSLRGRNAGARSAVIARLTRDPSSIHVCHFVTCHE